MLALYSFSKGDDCLPSAGLLAVTLPLVFFYWVLECRVCDIV